MLENNPVCPQLVFIDTDVFADPATASALMIKCLCRRTGVQTILYSQFDGDAAMRAHQWGAKGVLFKETSVMLLSQQLMPLIFQS